MSISQGGQGIMNVGGGGLKAGLTLARHHARSHHLPKAAFSTALPLSDIHCHRHRRVLSSYTTSSTQPSMQQLVNVSKNYYSYHEDYKWENCLRRGSISTFGTTRSGQKSPYVVLQISSNANKSEIKAAFRKVCLLCVMSVVYS